MKYQNLVRQAWRMTIDNKYLVQMGTMASIFAIIVGVFRVRYILKTPFTFTDLFEILQLRTQNPILWMVVFMAFFGLIYAAGFVTSVLAEGGMISAIAKTHLQNVKLNFSKSISLGLHAFLPLTEFRLITGMFHVGNIVILTLLLRMYLRVYGGDEYAADFMSGLSPLLIFITIFVAIMSIFLTYGQYNLVIHRAGVFASIRKSVMLVFYHLGETLVISILVALVFIRTILNVILVFLIPAGIVALMTFLSLKLSFMVTLSIGITVGLIILYFAAKLAGALYAFTTAVWTLLFLELEARKEYEIVPEEALSGEFDND